MFVCVVECDRASQYELAGCLDIAAPTGYLCRDSIKIMFHNLYALLEKVSYRKDLSEESSAIPLNEFLF